MPAISFDQETLTKLVQKAIFDEITPESRDELLRGAIRSLVEERKGDYGRTFPSLLQAAFNDAVGRIATKLAGEFFNGDTPQAAEARANIHKLIGEAYERAVTGEQRESLVNKMAATLGSALRDGS